MGAFTYLRELYTKKQSEVMRFILRLRCWEYRQLPELVRLTHPSRPDKARRMGYKAKQGMVVYRIRVRKGSRRRVASKNRQYGKPRTHHIYKLTPSLNLQAIAEQKAGKQLPSLRLLNSYWVNQDGAFKYFECIFVDPVHPAIQHDAKLNWICDSVHTRREARGLTAAGRKHRGLSGVGHGFRHLRPSRYADWKVRNVFKLRRWR
ncbi:60S ribosomal protein L15-1, putative [Trichomonas vaginalis G3]|uniref:Ribosomal protein L15 n=1 Tax=Trichomonas vaginalis (strain ATCC PRA-98 / G3) TaxID=412133 RepID=A2ECR7_TRIV3|nr:structural constituent of ribosome [Trichomonas vaginalis G3]XP_001309550.1 structural constituent of ribosome [Trichomonas vaginalis G3]XP_001321786.1 structural constituent of ribosome [Trichomonas vaginalis G3]5XY3_N Chain N, Ribosomal protein L15 [Trichomonas vaginalis]EAX88789.1 60S ribosomal protein L15-1, putative [Trichomonas vaginalis G3]EAX96620.1 60S ribosomal protein L15-1, putative [Trichomonas vaginalis G3]EAY09563.1 60S ribosomal protein L15-1, putative [Trichomonas vaginali|eukprot:XP_001301719.1 60S ribosomal protein L15-1 [Trichomonas vaginalis G3]